MAEVKRRKRLPALTARDGAALGWIGEHYVARADVLAVLLGRLSPVEGRPAGPVGMRTVRHHLDRWERSGLVVRRSMLGAMWAVPTAAGLAYGGLTYEPWTPSGHRLRHVHAVAVARLAAEAGRPELDWHGERRLRRLRGDAGRWHLPDGALPVEVPPREAGYAPTRAWHALEVELHQKSNDAPVRQAIVGGPGFPLAAVTYLCPPERVEGIRAQLARVTEALAADRAAKSARPEPLPRIEVLALPDVPGASYDGGW
jgi:hypothetical protein